MPPSRKFFVRKIHLSGKFLLLLTLQLSLCRMDKWSPPTVHLVPPKCSQAVWLNKVSRPHLSWIDAKNGTYVESYIQQNYFFVGKAIIEVYLYYEKISSVKARLIFLLLASSKLWAPIFVALLPCGIIVVLLFYFLPLPLFFLPYPPGILFLLLLGQFCLYLFFLVYSDTFFEGIYT